VPPQLPIPTAHWQLPALHIAAPAHTAPHAPQFRSSASTSVHAPPQSVSPTPHDAAHVPREQTSPASQTWPQAPQLVGSFASTTHTPPQSVPPTGHAQLPATHSVPPAQATPQAPQ